MTYTANLIIFKHSFRWKTIFAMKTRLIISGLLSNNNYLHVFEHEHSVAKHKPQTALT